MRATKWPVIIAASRKQNIRIKTSVLRLIQRMEKQLVIHLILIHVSKSSSHSCCHVSPAVPPVRQQ